MLIWPVVSFLMPSGSCCAYRTRHSCSPKPQLPRIVVIQPANEERARADEQRWVIIATSMTANPSSTCSILEDAASRFNHWIPRDAGR